MTYFVDTQTQKKVIKIICVEEGRELSQQLLRLISEDSRFALAYERNLDAVVDRFERDAYDIMLLSSSAAYRNPAEAREVLDLIAAKCPATQILFFVHPSKLKLAEHALRAGVFQYAHLPISDEELKLLITAAVDCRPQVGINLLLRSELEKTTFEQMIGRSMAMQQVYRQIRQAAATDIPVLLSGETGTGKELAARAIHEQSQRADKPYVPVHIGSVPPDLVASELFGHEKGAFTGALTKRKGCFEEADGGTVFLDEIATIDEKMQISLLRLLETHEFNRMGGEKGIAVDVRIIAASNADLLYEVQMKRFRKDLYYRLDVLQISMPPLKERSGDIHLLSKHFIKSACDRFGKEIRGISPDFVSQLERYSWPGNVRELKNVIQRAVVTCDGDILDLKHLPKRLQGNLRKGIDIHMHVGITLKEAEKVLIARTLEFTGQNRSRTSEILGISRRSLYNKLSQYDLQ